MYFSDLSGQSQDLPRIPPIAPELFYTCLQDLEVTPHTPKNVIVRIKIGCTLGLPQTRTLELLHNTQAHLWIMQNGHHMGE